MGRHVGARAAVAGVVLGHFVELYDFAVFAASASVLALVITPGQGGLTSILIVLAAALFVRPLGAVLVGRVADLTGRRVPFLVMSVLMTVCTAAIGLLPSAAAVGVAAAAALTVLRLAQAFSVGGETSTSVSYLFELAPADRRGLFGGVHLASAAVGMATGIGAVLLVQGVLDRAQLLAWGWRLPFLLALPLGLVMVALRRRLLESGAFAGARPGAVGEVQGSGAGPSLLRRRPRTILAGFLLGGAFSVTVTLWFVVVPGYLLATSAAGPGPVLGSAVVGLLVCAVLAPLAGRLSDRVGRPALLLAGCGVLCVAWPTLLADAMERPSPAALVGAGIVAGAALAGFVLGAYLPEAFPTRERATGVGVTYGVGSAVLGGAAPLVAAWLAGRDALDLLVVYGALSAGLAGLALVWATLRPDGATGPVPAPDGALLPRPRRVSPVSAVPGRRRPDGVEDDLVVPGDQPG